MFLIGNFSSDGPSIRKLSSEIQTKFVSTGGHRWNVLECQFGCSFDFLQVKKIAFQDWTEIFATTFHFFTPLMAETNFSSTFHSVFKSVFNFLVFVDSIFR